MYDKNVKYWLEQAGHEKRKEGIDLRSRKIKLAIALIEEEVSELKGAVHMNDPIEVLDAIVDIKWVINNLIHFSGLTKENIDKAEAEILKSNLSKFCKTEIEALDTVQAYKDGIHPDKRGKSIETYYTKEGDFFIVKRKFDNKIMKSMLYKPAQLTIDL